MADRDSQSQGRNISLSGGAYSLTYRPATGVVTGTGADWFGPLNPMNPVAPPEVKGRLFDFPSGYNLNIRPRSYEAITFEMLRAFADTYDILRLVIETRKDQLARMDWTVVPRDKKLLGRGSVVPGDMQTRIDKIKDFFLMPDQENFWHEWLSMLLEDLFVIDAPTLYRRKTYGGALYALQPLDGATIKRVIDDWGNTPEPPNAAYQQVLKGYPAVDYTTDELIYRPRVRRTHKVYGFSPVEQIIMTINIAMRRQAWQLQSFTEGNIPEALIGTPSQWTPDQVRQFQDWFDSVLEGNTGERRRARFVPGEVAKSYVPTKPTELFDAAEEWLARVVCFAFSVSPQPFVKMQNRATAESAHEAAISEGLAPIQNWIKGLMDFLLIKDFKSPDLEFKWQEEEELDPNVKSQIIDREQKAGRMTLNEARKDQGLDPFDDPEADRPMWYSPTTGFQPMLLNEKEQAIKDAQADAQLAGAKAAKDNFENPPKPAEEGAPGAAAAPGGPKPPAPAESGSKTPPEGKEEVKKGDWNEEDHPRDERGRFSGDGSGGGDSGGTSDHGGSDPSGHGAERSVADIRRSMVTGGTITQSEREKVIAHTAKESANRDRAAVQRQVGKDPAALRAVAEGHRTTASNYEKLGLHEGASQVRQTAAHLDQMADKWEQAQKSDEGVLQKGDGPFVHKEGCGCGLAKAGRASRSSKGNYADPLRPFAAKHEKRLTRALKSMLGRLAPDVAKQVKFELGKVAKAEYPDDFDVDKLLDDLDLSVLAISQDDLIDALSEVGGDAGRISLAQLGLQSDQKITEQLNERALLWAKDRAAELVSFDEGDPLLASASRDMLRALIVDGIERNLSTSDIGDLIEEAYAFSDDRAQLIAATEITSANSQGALAGYEEAKDAGVNVKKSWLVLEDGCDICQENADEGPIDLDEDFPSGDSAPGAHPNCRCVLVPEVEDGDGNVTEGEEEDSAELADRPEFQKVDNQNDMAQHFPVDTSLRGLIWAMGGNSEEATADREGGLLMFVAFDECVATQDYCDHDKVALYRDDPTAKGYAPMAYSYPDNEGTSYALQDGHHRAVASKLGGNRGMTMHVRPHPEISSTED